MDKELVILSIAGDLRKGKSFFLSLLLQYLKNGGQRFSSNKEVELEGNFRWRGGSKRHTQGIMMWSEPYCLRKDDGNEVAIILMDTQGLHDTEQTFADTSTIFAISLLTSSIQLYNTDNQIQTNDLQNFQVFTSYGSQISGLNEPFQDLIFLIRDWMNSYEYGYGWEGGQRYLNDIMEVKSNQFEPLKQLRIGLNSTFSKINCFLMPHPGLKVAEGNFTNVDINSQFINNLNEFAAKVFNPEDLQIKKIAGNYVNGRKLVEYLKFYLGSFGDKERLRPETIYEATCRANYVILKGEAQLFFTKSMSEKCVDQISSIDPKELHLYFSNAKNGTIDILIQNNNIKCENMFEKYLFNLEKWTEEQFTDCRMKNYMKRINERDKVIQEFIEEKSSLQYSNLLLEKELRNMKIQQNTCNLEKSKCTSEKNSYNTKLDICNLLKNDCHEEKVQCVENKEAFEQKLKETKTQGDFFLAAISGKQVCRTYTDCAHCVLPIFSTTRCCFRPDIDLGVNNLGVCLCQGDQIKHAFGLTGGCG